MGFLSFLNCPTLKKLEEAEYKASPAGCCCSTEDVIGLLR